MRIDEIQQQLGRGEYEVDTHAVADAIVRRLMAVTGRGSSERADERAG